MAFHSFAFLPLPFGSAIVLGGVQAATSLHFTSLWLDVERFMRLFDIAANENDICKRGLKYFLPIDPSSSE